MHNKIRNERLIACAVAGLIVGALVAVASTTPKRVSFSTTTTGGTYTYTNEASGYGQKLVSIETFNSVNLTNQLYVYKISSDNSRTSTVCTVTNASGTGIWRDSNTTYVFYGEKLYCSSLVATGMAVEVTTEQNP